MWNDRTILRLGIEEPDCEDCGREGGHTEALYMIGDDRGAKIEVCPESPGAGTDEACCDRCDRDMTGDMIFVIGHADGPEGDLSLCEPCLAVLEGETD